MSSRTLSRFLLTVAFVASLTACGSDDVEEVPALPSPTPTSSDSDDAIAVVEAFWDERIRVETSGDYQSADFDGLLDASLAEPLAAQYSSLDGGNFRRVGSPELRDFKATVDQTTAVVTVCVNEDDWGAEADVEVEERPDMGFYVDAYALEATEGAWVIVDQPDAPAGVKC